MLGGMATYRGNMSANPMTCLLADDSGLVLDALDSYLRSEGIGVVGRARTGVQALNLLERLPATAIVLDLRLPDLNGIEVARRAVEIIRRKTAIVLYTSFADPTDVADALEVGARGVVVKDGSPSNLLDALSAVAAGRIYLDPLLRRVDSAVAS
jgi:DNA-binding NarL/FixJ family response regulator